ncbi:MAG TPA: hypothetical protein VNX01_14215 [Bacteroidia bacterium]|jgi:hypothetical protein|nr:hypothetical protein [Bacteroidia bacterium]
MCKRIFITVISLFITGKVILASDLNKSASLPNQSIITQQIIPASICLVGDTLSVSFGVNGLSACKSSIEGSVTANAGVLSASWDASSKTITISYISSQIKKSDLYTFLAVAGYDNAELRAKDAVYAALPAACQYTRDPDNE